MRFDRAMNSTALVFLVVVFCAGLECAAAGRISYQVGEKLLSVKDGSIRENSGTVQSRRLDEGLWVHNDSGDSARLFLLDKEGTTRNILIVEGANARDWEDMAAFDHRGIPMLVVGDVGDNRSRRESVQLYFFEEPMLSAEISVHAEPVWAKLDVTLEDGAVDCESVAVDTSRGVVLLIEKSRGGSASVYEVALPRFAGSHSVIARKLSSIPVSMATGADISPDGSRLIIGTYLLAYEFLRQDGETWKEALAKTPRSLPLPIRKQGESICYLEDGESLAVGSEGKNQPVWILRNKPAD